ncbi:MAG: ferrous iron transport protein B, partial [Chitinophagales bacterium]
MKNTHIALIGNPNSGKSSLFNHLTGLRQKTGNFPGITVDRKKGFLFQNSQIEITDLPGLYNLYPNSKDEAVVLKELFKANQETGGHPYDGIVYVAEAQHLDRSLLLYSQIADLGIPTLFVINMIDEAQKSGYKIDKKALQNRLGIPIFETNARSGEGVAAVRTALEQNKLFQPNTFFRSRYENAASFATAENQSPYKNWLQQHFTTYLLEGQDQAKNQTPAEKEAIELAVFNDIQSRQQFTHQIAKNIVQLPSETKNQRRTEQIDRWLTHPVFGYAFFLLILYFIFQAIFSWSTWPMDLIDGAFGSLSEWVKGTLGDNLISNLITEGVIPGIGGVVIFIPQIALLFLFIGLLEASGYMARVVFLMDKLMQQFGLNGKSVVPLVSGLACSIPAVMAARTIENPKERLLTILVTPFMTCAARLPVYAIIIAVTIPAVNVLPGVSLQGLTLLGLYLLGTLAALLSAAILNRFITSNHASHLVLEMPIYRMPTWKDVGINIYMKVRSFVWEAGRIIFVISLVLWFLASYGPGDLAQKTNDFETELTQNNT